MNPHKWSRMASTVVVGGFFGDEGKGKIVAYLAMKDDPAIVVRAGVGPNAGHTIQLGGRKFFLRMVPSGFVNEKALMLIGAGVLVNPKVLLKEMEETSTKGRIGLDPQCAIIEDGHIEREEKSVHLSQKIGSTRSGVGACAADRALRIAKLAKEIPELSGLLMDVSGKIHAALEGGKRVLVEGTQGTFLSLYHGTYPYCTAKDTCASALCSDVGIGPKDVGEVLITFKSYVTRVGEGPLEGQLPREEVERRGWLEYGTVTRRERRAAPFNFELARRAVMLNSATQIALTKLDVLFPEAKGARDYRELPAKAREFIGEIESATKIPVAIVGTGPGLDEVIDRRSDLDG